ncbi:MAG: mechanosensitive ion channel [Spirochaetales bacterium]|nr:mechanosensitive ion channel [Spirochaetales bacterium]
MDFLTALHTIQLGDYTVSVSIFNVIFKLILPVFAMIVGYSLLMLAVRKILSLAKAEEKVSEKVRRWSRMVFKLALFLGILGALGSVLGISAYRYINDFLRFLKNPFFETGGTSISIVTIILVIPIFYLASWSGKLVQSLLEKNIFPDLSTLDEARKMSIGNFARFTTLALVLLFMLSVIGIDLTALGVVFGALGIGVGFGLQDLVANFFAGVVILFARQIKMNDRILVNDIEGNVSDIKLLSTTVTTLQNENIIIPNSHIINHTMHNYSYNNREVILVNSIGVHYKTDLDRALELLEEIGADNPWHQRNTEIRSFVRSFDNSGITLELWVTVRDVNFRLQAFAWTNLEIWRRFRDGNIEIPYPQVDLHIKDQVIPTRPEPPAQT